MRTQTIRFKSTFLLIPLLTLTACTGSESADKTDKTSQMVSAKPSQKAAYAPPGNPDGIVVPTGFKVSLFAEGVGPARHMVARPDGTVYVRLSEATEGGCLVALQDKDKNGQAEMIQGFGDSSCGTGLALDANYVYYSTKTEIWRQVLGKELIPTGKPERIAMNLGTPGGHSARSLALDGAGNIYVNIGAPSNSCQVKDRRAGSLGQQPCELLKEFGGIWRFKIDQKDQNKALYLRYATGIRNAVAIDWNPTLKQLFIAQHGRDQLDTLFPEHFSAEQNSELPAEEFIGLNQNDNVGWPYCYFDPDKKQKVLAPEYGGDGIKTGDCAQYKQPVIGFPAHYAPNDLLFYRGSQFPKEYHQGAFIAFHGSWNRDQQQQGYQVVFVPFTAGKATKWDVFAKGFASEDPNAVISDAGEARYRPVGLAEMADGSLLVADSNEGRIWKISYLRP